MEARKQQYLILSALLSQLSDDEITGLKRENGATNEGENYVITMQETKIFVKRILVTRLEYENRPGTANLYDLPTYYNYRLGSYGISCFRELAIHLKTTNWVLDDKIPNFPLLYHHRIMKNENPSSAFRDEEHLDQIVTNWNGNQQIRKYLIDKQAAEHEIVLFLEYFPSILYKQLGPEISQITSYLTQITKIVDFMRANGVIHFDAHDKNILINGTEIYLTDFGLVMDREFDLTKEERIFFDNNDYYSYGTMARNLLSPLWEDITKNKEYFREKYGELDSSTVFDYLDEIGTHLGYEAEYLSLLRQYQPIIVTYCTFVRSMRQNDKKDDLFPNDQIRELYLSNHPLIQ